MKLYLLFFFIIKTYLTRMTHQPEAVLHEVLPYTTTQLINIKHSSMIHMAYKDTIKTIS